MVYIRGAYTRAAHYPLCSGQRQSCPCCWVLMVSSCPPCPQGGFVTSASVAPAALYCLCILLYCLYLKKLVLWLDTFRVCVCVLSLYTPAVYVLSRVPFPEVCCGFSKPEAIGGPRSKPEVHILGVRMKLRSTSVRFQAGLAIFQPSFLFHLCSSSVTHSC